MYTNRNYQYSGEGVGRNEIMKEGMFDLIWPGNRAKLASSASKS